MKTATMVDTTAQRGPGSGDEPMLQSLEKVVAHGTHKEEPHGLLRSARASGCTPDGSDGSYGGALAPAPIKRHPVRFDFWAVRTGKMGNPTFPESGCNHNTTVFGVR